MGIVSAALIVLWLGITLTTQRAPYSAIWLTFAIPALIGSIVLVAFGTIVIEVQETRKAADRQNEFLLAIRDRLGR